MLFDRAALVLSGEAQIQVQKVQTYFKKNTIFVFKKKCKNFLE